jgi:hypothetical protein
MISISQKERDIRRKLPILKHADENGHAAKTLQVLWRCKGQLLSLEGAL